MTTNADSRIDGSRTHRARASAAVLPCITDWQAASITHATTQQMMVRGLIERQAATRFVLTLHGRAVLAVLLR
jgi:hypothetical protein